MPESIKNYFIINMLQPEELSYVYKVKRVIDFILALIGNAVFGNHSACIRYLY